MASSDPTRLSLSDELREVIEEAEDIAYASGQHPGSVHLLLAFFTAKSRTERFLRERSVDEDALLAHVDPRETEPRGAVRAIMERAAQVGAGCGAEQVEGLHVLVGMTRVRESGAYRLLERAGVPLTRLRTRALTLLTGAAPRWLAREAEVDAPQAGGNRPHHLSRRPLPNEALEAGRPRAVSWSPPLLEPPKKTQRRDPPPPGSRAARPPRAVSGVASSVVRPAEPAEARPPPARPAPAPPVVSSVLPTPEPEPAPEAPSPAADPGAAWMLPDGDFPWLSSLGRNLSVEAARGELDVLVGREAEVEQLVDVLGKRRANNPCLVGEPGVGKTAIVEGLAARWVAGSPSEQERIVIGLDAGRLLVGTHLRGSFNEKLRGLQDEVKRAEGKVLVFFDELHTLIGAGATSDGPLDAANELKAALARGDFPCVGATTPEEFEQHVAKDPALERRFVRVLVEEPRPEAAEAMLYRILPAYADHHGIGYTPEAVRTSVRLSVRFLPEQRLPDKAIALLDLAGSRAARAGLEEVTPREIAMIVGERTGVPVERLLASDTERLLGLEEALARRVVGHRRSLERMAEVIRRHAAGFGSHRPLGVFLLVGPSGVGKTETAKALAELLHAGDDQALVRFDLSEFSEAHAVARLIGAPPGYVGHEAGGQLTEAIRKRPGRVILLDEIDKAHREVLQVLLPILDDGRLTDGRGRTVSFAESVIILTSNLGAEVAAPRKRKLGFGDGEPPREDAEAAVLAAVRRALPPELWGRIDERLYYPPLERAQVRRIARMLVAESSARLERERGIRFELDGRALDALVEQGGLDAQLGARPLRRLLGHLVEGPIAARVLEGRLHAGESVTVSRREGSGLVFRVRSPRRGRDEAWGESSVDTPSQA